MSLWDLDWKIHLEILVQMIVMESRDESVALDPLDSLENLASLEFRDQKVILDPQDPKENKVNPVHLVTKVKVAKMAMTDLLGLQVIHCSLLNF